MPVFDAWAARVRQQRQRSFAEGLRHYLPRYALVFAVLAVAFAVASHPSAPRLAALIAVLAASVLMLSALQAGMDRGTARIFDRLAGGPDNPGELSWAANHRSSRLRSVGGRLRVVDGRVEFCPNAVDSALRGKPWACQLSEIAGIGVERSGAPRTQLHLICADGKDGWFIVNDPEGVATALRGVQDSGGA